MVNRRRNQSSFMNRIRRLDSNSQKTLIIACSVFLIIFIITFALISRGEDNYKKILDSISYFGNISKFINEDE